LFFDKLDESYIIHEAAHVIFDRIKRKQKGVESERLPKLAELLNQRYNGRDMSEIFSYLEESSDDKLVHDIANEENFIALYEIKTGIKMSNLNVAEIKDALRGASPSEIARLADITTKERVAHTYSNVALFCIYSNRLTSIRYYLISNTLWYHCIM